MEDKIRARELEWKEIARKMEEGADKNTKRLFNKKNKHLQQPNKKTRKALDFLEEEYPELICLEPREWFDEAIIGVVDRIHKSACFPAILYDSQKIIRILMRHRLHPLYITEPFEKGELQEVLEEEGAEQSYEEALDYFEYNIKGGFLGDHSPIFLDRKVDL